MTYKVDVPYLIRMLDSNFTGAVIRSFSDALQTSLAFKTKLASGLGRTWLLMAAPTKFVAWLHAYRYPISKTTLSSRLRSL